jgi:ribosomal protein L28
MARECALCGKHTQAGVMSARNVKKSSGWYHRAPHKPRKFVPNLQPRKVNFGMGIMTVRVCTKCLKTMVKV